MMNTITKNVVSYTKEVNFENFGYMLGFSPEPLILKTTTGH